MRFLPIFCLLVVAALMPAAAHAAAVPPPLTADFTIAPDAPRPGEPVTFTSTSLAPSGDFVATEWDLDNDGEFDDGRKPVATRAFPAGTHTVRLEARTTTHTEVKSRSFTVADAPAPTPTPTATATAAPNAANQPPVAAIELHCGKIGKLELCLTPQTRVHDAKTFDASPSSDPDGTIARYEWDLDGNGSFEAEGVTATRTYGDMNPVTIRLRVTDDKGATSLTTLALNKLEPECETRAAKGMLSASSPCFRRYHYEAGDGKTVLGFDGKLKSGAGISGDQYRSTLPVRVNGIELVPAPGKAVIINMLDRGKGVKLEVGTPDGTATLRKGGELITVDSGRIWWKIDGKELEGVELPAVQKQLGGLPITAMQQRLTLGAGAIFDFTVQMPAQFGAPTSDKPVRVQVGGLKAKAAASDAGFHFEVENAVLGPIALYKLVLDYDGDDSWLIKADAKLPAPIAGRLKADAGIRDGAFDHAGADLTFDDPGMSIVGPVFLKRIAFRVEFSPKQSECVPHVGKAPTPGPLGQVPPAAGMPQPEPKDYGVPSFALCGEVGLVAGGTILGRPVIGLNAGLGFAMFDDRPAVLRAFGDVLLVGEKLFDGEFEMHSDGYIEVDASAKWVWPGVAIMHGSLGVEMRGTKFNAHGRVEACIEVVDYCAVGARAVASNAGVAVCLKIDYGVDTWEPGIGYKWGESPTIYFAGCELGPYKTDVPKARAASAGERTIELPAGLPGAAIAVVGRDRAPDVTLVGPKGERISGVGRVPQGLIVKSDAEKVTQIAVVKPSAGRWTIETSDAVERVMSAQGLEPVKVKAKVRGGKLEYTIDERPGQKVTFAERGPSAGAIIGVAKGAKGTLRFDPADGKAEKRQIVAIVEQDGMPRGQVAVASYRAPKAAKPAKARGVKLTRGAKTLRVSWKKGAPSHVVSVKLGDGRRLVRRVDGRSSLTLRNIPRRVRATATVRAVGRNGMLARAATRART